MKSLPELILAYNHLTNPSKLKTAEQHESDKKEVLEIRRQLSNYEKGFDYQEDENGKLLLSSTERDRYHKYNHFRGRIFRHKETGKKYILAQVNDYRYYLINLATGVRFSDRENPFGDEEENFEKISD